nr:DUF5677 domain-containing protein [uncultured Tolumonas sp.]
MSLPKSFSNTISEFDKIAEIGYDLSQLFNGVTINDKQKTRSTYFLAKAIDNAISILTLLPNNRVNKNKTDYFDYSSISALSRNLLELCNLHWYFCEEDIPLIESEFRWLLYEYHEVKTLEKLSIDFDLETDNSIYSDLLKYKQKLNENVYFNTLPLEFQRQTFKGRKATHLNQNEIAHRRGIDEKLFSTIYKVLSNEVHTMPLSLSAMVFTKTHDKDIHIAFLGLTLNFISSLLAHLILFITHRWELEFALNKSAEIINYYAQSLTSDT